MFLCEQNLECSCIKFKGGKFSQMKNVKRNVKAISPVLAVLMMIAVAIAGSLITYAWVTGYISFTTDKAGQAIMIQSMAYDNDTENLYVYVQNVGEGAVELDAQSCLYINDGLQPCTVDLADGVIPEKDTATLTVPYTVSIGQKITAKVTTKLGTFTEKSNYPASTTGGVVVTPPPDVDRVQATTTGFVSPTAGNFLVVVAGHRTDDPNANPTPTLAGWTRQEVSFFKTPAHAYDRRIVAIFTKISDGGETSVTVNWDGSASSSFVLYQEFTGATTYQYIASGTNYEGYRLVHPGPDTWATSPMYIPGSALSDPGGENILSIGAAVWRDDVDDISNVGFTGLLDGDVTDLSGSCDGASAFSYGNAVTQTSLSWSGDGTEMVSGLLVLFACS